MYFIIHNSRLYQFGLAYSPLARYGFTMLSLSIGMFFWYYLLYCTMLNSADSIRTKNEQLSGQRCLMEEQKKLHATNQKKLQLLSAAIDTMISQNYVHSSMRDRMIFVVNQLSQNKLFLDGSCAVKDTNKNWYRKKTMAYDFKGNFNNIFLFFSQLYKAQQLMQCKELIIEKVSNDILKMHCLIDFIELEKAAA